MDYIRFSINNPVKVAVGVLLLLLFGLLALFAIPIQLTPNVDAPVITITTNWVGRSPQEVERALIEEQEDKLKSVTNLKKMTSKASQGQAEISLEFHIGTDIRSARLEVSDKLREVPAYPEEVDQPVITTADVAAESPIAWMILTASDPDFPIESLKDLAEDRIKPDLERVSGLAEVRVYGGRERQVHILVDPRRLAERGIRFNQFRSALRLENVNISAGTLPEGRLDVSIRTVGEYNDLDKVRQTIVAYGEGGPVRVRDVADVELTFEKQRAFVRSKGRAALALPAYRETGSNVVQVMEAMKERLKIVNEEVLPAIAPPGVTLQIEQVYDETVYIYDALDLVLNNLWMGGSLAVIILLLFLRKLRPTAIIGLAIPISVIGTFVVMTAFGRNLNVISLAGLAFAVGMVVDNAIVVLENIDRHIGMGKSPPRAAYDGTKEVWGAVLASTLTTLAVFLPVLTIQEEAGQLFRDISLAICAAVALSLIVSVTVIPTASARFLKPIDTASRRWTPAQILEPFASFFGRLVALFASTIHYLIGPGVRRVGLRVALIGLFMVASIGGAWLLMPPTTYLPNGNRNLVFGLIFTPPGYNMEQDATLATRVEAMVRPYWEATSFEETAKLPPVINFNTGRPYDRVPPIENFFFVSIGSRIFAGAASADKEVVEPLGSLLTGAMNQLPGAFGFAQQVSLFGRGIGGSNSVEVEFKGTDLNQVRQAASAMFMTLMTRPELGFSRIQPDPGNFNLAAPELQVQIDRVRAADLGIDVASLGLGVQALIDGAKVGDYRLFGESIDILMVRDPGFSLQPETLAQVPVAFEGRDGTRGQVPLGAIANIRWTDAPQQIKRIEELRAVTLTVVPPPDMPLETARLQLEEIAGNLRQQGAIARGVEVDMAGTASKLVEVREAMLGEWHGWNARSLRSLISSRMFLALLVTYLLMAALFESWLYPFVIMFSVPLATVGGFMGLAVVHAFNPNQLLDVLTMLGFVILIGIVVNNAILLVHQSLNFMRGIGESGLHDQRALSPRDAVRESVRTRIRPIFMTTLTSVFGMLPLVLVPGSGTELYKGLGSVVLGGLLVSTVFTLVVVPLVFSVALDAKIWAYRRLGWPVPELNETETLERAAAAEPASV